MLVSFVGRLLCFVAKGYILQQKCLNKWIGSAVRGEEHNGRTFNPYTDAEHHNAQRHRQTERRPYGANSGSYCLQYDRLTTESIKSARKKYPSEKAVNSE